MERLTIREIEAKSELLYWFFLNNSVKKVKEVVKAINKAVFSLIKKILMDWMK